MVSRDDGGTTGTARNAVRDGNEAGLANIGISLYYHVNGNKVIDSGDLLWATTTTADGSGTAAVGYYGLTVLPDADFLVEVDAVDADRPAGWSLLGEP